MCRASCPGAMPIGAGAHERNVVVVDALRVGLIPTNTLSPTRLSSSRNVDDDRSFAWEILRRNEAWLLTHPPTLRLGQPVRDLRSRCTHGHEDVERLRSTTEGSGRGRRVVAGQHGQHGGVVPRRLEFTPHVFDGPMRLRTWAICGTKTCFCWRQQVRSCMVVASARF